MIRVHTITRRMLARNGVAAIWQLQVAAGIAYQNGNLGPAASIMEIADAAERAWMWQKSEPVRSEDWPG